METVSRAQVNSLNAALLTDIAEGITELEGTPGVKAFVLATAYEGRAFSAGLDLLEMCVRRAHTSPMNRGDAAAAASPTNR